MFGKLPVYYSTWVLFFAVGDDDLELLRRRIPELRAMLGALSCEVGED